MTTAIFRSGHAFGAEVNRKKFVVVKVSFKLEECGVDNNEASGFFFITGSHSGDRCRDSPMRLASACSNVELGRRG